ncbi:site-specific DNA-methyltransferase [Pectobacterium aquaticum]|uniref:site-specific DNA-methyltransferase (adenine-specific) n=1 Tax=Pectobacterium aquaticum TaxID=2204145 RepID=A0A3R8NQG5_9GAMM|nr:site-specific DNA-methyltransferase [Pectobacterium aquaticum]RRO11072.1 site-specific DNA-methyltransferase [Pectobacterium aquaticum]
MKIKEEKIYSKMETANSKQIATLKKHFPSFFDRNGDFIQERMLEIVNSRDVEPSKESYSLNWLGKSYSRLLANLPPKTLMCEDIAHNSQDQHKNSKNLLIKGDNLEVLKHLIQAYSEKVNMIYIDPPYNTGSDGFVYDDTRKFTKEQLSELAGIDIEEAERVLNFTDQGSNSHSAWLTFMYPRLYVARELLKEDGVIFISIDDNECPQLKLLCDEIFGEFNFYCTFIWQKRSGSMDSVDGVSIDHEYVLCYGKSKGRLNGVLRTFEKYTNPDNDPRGPWISDNLSAGKAGGDVYYEITDPKTGNKFYPPKGRFWPYNPASMNKKIAEGRVIFPNSPNGRPMLKRFRSEAKSLCVPVSTLMRNHTEKNLPNNAIISALNTFGTAEIQELFGAKVFSFPKSTILIKSLMSQVLTEDEDNLVLDFFAGSGTTAEAVLKLNLEGSVKSNFILVQSQESISQGTVAHTEGFENIFDITSARIKNAVERININTNPPMDLGFRVFETVDDFRRVDDEVEDILSNLTMFDDALLTDEQYRILLTTWALYDGAELTTPIIDIDLNGYKAHLCDRYLYMIASGFNSDALKDLLHKLDDTEDKNFDPNKIVYYANNFDSVKQMELNEALKSYENKKSIEIDMVARY